MAVGAWRAGLDEAAVTACVQDKPQIEALQTRLKAAAESRRHRHPDLLRQRRPWPAKAP